MENLFFLILQTRDKTFFSGFLLVYFLPSQIIGARFHICLSSSYCGNLRLDEKKLITVCHRNMKTDEILFLMTIQEIKCNSQFEFLTRKSRKSF